MTMLPRHNASVFDDVDTYWRMFMATTPACRGWHT